MPLLRSRSAPAPLALLIVVLAALLAGCGSAGSSQSGGANVGRTIGHAPTAHTFTYVAIGASDGYGIGTDDPDRLNWPSVLAGELGVPAVHLVNLAIPGATVSEALRAELPVALVVHPDVVTIWLAVNDLADGVDLSSYTKQLTTLASTLRQRTQARIYIGNLPDLTLVPYFASDDPTALAAQVATWNAAIAHVCQRTGAHLVDLRAGWSDLASHPEYISSDGLHPSTVGAARIAAAFAAVMRSTNIP